MDEIRFCQVPKTHNVIKYKELSFCKFILLESILGMCLLFLCTGLLSEYLNPFTTTYNDLFVMSCFGFSAFTFILTLILLYCFANPKFGGVQELTPYQCGQYCRVLMDLCDVQPRFIRNSRSEAITSVGGDSSLPSYSEVRFTLPTYSEITNTC